MAFVWEKVASTKDAAVHLAFFIPNEVYGRALSRFTGYADRLLREIDWMLEPRTTPLTDEQQLGYITTIRNLMESFRYAADDLLRQFSPK